jgi:hypothetical protein
MPKRMSIQKNKNKEAEYKILNEYPIRMYKGETVLQRQKCQEGNYEASWLGFQQFSNCPKTF